MSDTPLERAARALALQEISEWDSAELGGETPEQVAHERWAEWLDGARVVLEMGFRAGYQAAVDEKVEGGYQSSRHLHFEDQAWRQHAHFKAAAKAASPS